MIQLTGKDPVSPMLAKAVATVPPQPEGGGYSYEPKWDGFRAIVSFDGENIEIWSRGSKPLAKYFPELRDALAQQLPCPCVVDGEIVVRSGAPGRERLDWEALSQRIHPAESRISLLARQTPASFIAFDLLAFGEEWMLSSAFSVRRSELELAAAGFTAPLHLSQVTTDFETANRWLVEFEGAGLDGVMTKPLDAPYSPGKRVMFKTKHHRTADVVVLGYRIHTSGRGVGSLLLGLYDNGEVRNVGGASAFSDARRLSLIEELEPLVLRDDDGKVLLGETERSRFTAAKAVSYVRLQPTLVAEVRYDQMEGMRFRHTAQFFRWRPDREATSCTFEQLETPVAYDLSKVLVAPAR